MPATGAAEVQSNRLGVVALFGEVAFGATGAVATNTANDPDGFTFTRDQTGRYSVTFAEKFPDMLGAVGTPVRSTHVDGHWEIHTAYNATTGVVVLSHVVAGSEADPASSSSAKFTFHVKASDV